MEKNSEQLIGELIKLINELIKKVDSQNQQIKTLSNTIKASTVIIDKSTVDDFNITINKCNQIIPTNDPFVFPSNLKKISDKFENNYQDEDINF